MQNGTCVASQLESLASFSAVIDRLGEFEEVVNAPKAAQAVAAQPGIAATSNGAADSKPDSEPVPQAALPAAESSRQPDAAGAAAALAQGEHIQILDEPAAAGGSNGSSDSVLLALEGVTLRTPDGGATLVQKLDLQVLRCHQLYTRR